jgi:hypothetical protein
VTTGIKSGIELNSYFIEDCIVQLCQTTEIEQMMERIMECLLIKMGAKIKEEMRLNQEDRYPASQDRSEP